MRIKRTGPLVASLIGQFGSSNFRLSPLQCRVALGIVLLFRIGPRPFHHGIEDEAEQSFGRPCRQLNAGSSDQANSPHPSSREGHLSTAGWKLDFAPIGLDPVRLSCCYAAVRVSAELGAVHPMRVHDHGQPSRQATIAFFMRGAWRSCIAQALSQDHFLERSWPELLRRHRAHLLVPQAIILPSQSDLARLVLGALSQTPAQRTWSCGSEPECRQWRIGQRHSGTNARGRHQALAHLVIPDDDQQAACRMTICSRSTRRTNEHRFVQNRQVGEILDKLLIRARTSPSQPCDLETIKLRNVPAGHSRGRSPWTAATGDG